MGLRDLVVRLFGRARPASGDVVGVLVAIDGELAGEVYRLCDGENRLGRSEACDVVLPSRFISRSHAVVVHEDGIFAIAALTDRSRTLVNGEEVDGTELRDSDTIRLGRTTFRFRTVDPL